MHFLYLQHLTPEILLLLLIKGLFRVVVEMVVVLLLFPAPEMDNPVVRVVPLFL
jgi:hypothetical protein